MKFWLYILLFLFTNSINSYASDSRFSGNPIPRFVSISKSPTNTRIGPDISYPVKYIYQTKYQPVKVVNEYYDWYQIEDINGDLSWIYKNSTTNKANYVMTIHNDTKLYQKKKLTSRIVAKVNRGQIFKVLKCSSGFCKVETIFNGTLFKGFLIQDSLWGI